MSDLGTPSPEAIVTAALERAEAKAMERVKKYAAATYDKSTNTPAREHYAAKCYCAGEIAEDISILASDPAEVAAIIKAAGEDL